MMTRTGLAALAACALLIPACQEAPADKAGASAEANSGDEQSIRSTNDRWLQLIAAKDAQGVAQLYADDAVVMPQGEPIQRGREAIRQWWAKSMEMPGYQLTFDEEAVQIASAGDMAIDRGTWRFRANPPSGKIEDSGKYIVVWRKVGDEWKVAADIYNSDRQPPA